MSSLEALNQQMEDTFSYLESVCSILTDRTNKSIRLTVFVEGSVTLNLDFLSYCLKAMDAQRDGITLFTDAIIRAYHQSDQLKDVANLVRAFVAILKQLTTALMQQPATVKRLESELEVLEKAHKLIKEESDHLKQFLDLEPSSEAEDEEEEDEEEDEEEEDEEEDEWDDSAVKGKRKKATSAHLHFVERLRRYLEVHEPIPLSQLFKNPEDVAYLEKKGITDESVKKSIWDELNSPGPLR